MKYAPIVLLNLIPDSFNNVKSTMKYGRDSFTLDIVVDGLKSKEFDLRHSVGGRDGVNNLGGYGCEG